MPPLSSTQGTAFGRVLRELGYVEGKNIAIEYRSADGKIERLPALAAELVRLKVDVIVASLTTRRCSRPRTQPVRFPLFLWPALILLRTGWSHSLARPGGNITGLTMHCSELAENDWRLLKEIIPKLARVAVVWNPQSPGSARRMERNAQLPARALELQLRFDRSKQTPTISRAALQTASKWRSGAARPAGEPIHCILIRDRSSILRLNIDCRQSIPSKNLWTGRRA